MHIQLTTAYSVGDLDAASPYAEIKIISSNMQPVGDTVSFCVQRGNFSGPTWVPGVIGTGCFSISGEDYNTIVDAAADSELSIEINLVKVLYQWLLDEAHYVGTIIP